MCGGERTKKKKKNPTHKITDGLEHTASETDTGTQRGKDDSHTGERQPTHELTGTYTVVDKCVLSIRAATQKGTRARRTNPMALADAPLSTPLGMSIFPHRCSHRNSLSLRTLSSLRLRHIAPSTSTSEAPGAEPDPRSHSSANIRLLSRLASRMRLRKDSPSAHLSRSAILLDSSLFPTVVPPSSLPTTLPQKVFSPAPWHSPRSAFPFVT